MNIYLASGYSRREEMKDFRKSLEGVGHKVTSRWLDFEDENPDAYTAENAGTPSNCHPHMREEIAVIDVQDVLTSDCLILFLPSGRRGGCQVEYGIALGLFLRVIVVGAPENVFHFHPHVERHDAFDQALAALTP